jgi:hypothetical protein
LLKKIIILKKLSHILRTVLISVLWCVSSTLLAQSITIPSDTIQTYAVDSLNESDPSDTVYVQADTLRKPDTKGMDSLQIPNEKGDIEEIIFYRSEDSIMMDVPNKKAYLYGKAQIKYKDMQLDADQITIAWDKNMICAKGLKDSTGRYIRYPVWKQGGDTYVTDSMCYNMKSKKAMIYGIATKQGEGVLTGDTSKRTEEAIYLKNGIYSTCDRKHPHFYINARKLKVIPDDKALCGPFNIVIEDIPTPIGFWLGFFPISDKKKSGIIFPTFGENANRGMYFSRGGYYWAVNDYIGAQVLGDVYANGSWLANLDANYIKRYKYRGNFDAGFSKVKDGFDKHVEASNQFRIVWQHNTMSKVNGTFSASVNLSSSKYAKSNFATVNRTQNVTTSSVTYSRSFGRSPFSTSVSMRGSQNNYQATANNNSSAIYNMTLPAASLTMNRINPLKRKYGDGNKWFEKIFVNYQGNFNYDFNNVQAFYDTTTRLMKDSTLQVNEANLNKYILPNAIWAANHQATISSTFKVFKYFNLNPSASYFENWHSKRLQYTRVNDSTTKVTDTLRGFYRTYYMNTSLEANTRIYGTYHLSSKGAIRGIRHTVNPSVRMTYAPDFSNIKGGGWTKVEGDVDSEGKTRKYFQYQSNPTPQFTQAVLDFTLSNILEAKVRNRKDTTGKDEKKVTLLDNLSLAGGYNFGADSLKMKNIVINARTKLFNRFDINLTSTYDPYKWVADSVRYINGKNVYYRPRQINTFLYDSNKQLAQLSVMNLTIGTRLAPKKKVKKDPKINNPQMQAELDQIRGNPNMYVDFNIPWSLALNFTFNYTHTGIQDPVINEAITASGDFSLTPKTKIIYSTGYNIREHVMTYSNFTISRDLHCWQMNMTLSPFGSFRTFNFMISAKSSLLQQLKLNKRSPTFVQ